MNNTALIMLAAAIFFALIIERILEIAKCVYDYVEARNDWGQLWTRRANAVRERLQIRFEKTRGHDYERAVFEYLAARYVSTEHPGYEGAPVISAMQLRAFTVKGVSKFLGAALGLVVAFYLEINVFKLIGDWTKTDAGLPFGLFETKLPHWLELAITGVVMGLGSGPMHKFIAALERAKRNRKSTEAV